MTGRLSPLPCLVAVVELPAGISSDAQTYHKDAEELARSVGPTYHYGDCCASDRQGHRDDRSEKDGPSRSVPSVEGEIQHVGRDEEEILDTVADNEQSQNGWLSVEIHETVRAGPVVSPERIPTAVQ